MNSTVLLQKLIVIERSIGTVDHATLRMLVQEAMECVLQMQNDSAETLVHRSYNELREAF